MCSSSTADLKNSLIRVIGQTDLTLCQEVIENFVKVSRYCSFSMSGRWTVIAQVYPHNIYFNFQEQRFHSNVKNYIFFLIKFDLELGTPSDNTCKSDTAVNRY